MSDDDARAVVPSTSASALALGLEKLELPSKLVVTRGPGFFELSWRWQDQVTREQFFTPLFSSAGCFLGLAKLARHSLTGAAIASSIFCAVIGLALIAYAKNVMRVRVSQGLLAFRSGPIGRGGTEIVADDVADIVAAPPKKPHKDGGGWSVHVLFKAERMRMPKRPKTIVGALLKREQAEQIASLLRSALAGESD